MLEITKKKSRVNISLTRGDSAYLTLNIINGDSSYIPQNGDVVHCQVRTAANTGELLFESKINGNGSDTAVWHIVPNDTSSLTPSTYVWDAQIEFSNGDIFTFIPASDFTITDEVTMDDN